MSLGSTLPPNEQVQNFFAGGKATRQFDYSRPCSAYVKMSVYTTIPPKYFCGLNMDLTFFETEQACVCYRLVLGMFVVQILVQVPSIAKRFCAVHAAF